MLNRAMLAGDVFELSNGCRLHRFTVRAFLAARFLQNPLLDGLLAGTVENIGVADFYYIVEILYMLSLDNRVFAEKVTGGKMPGWKTDVLEFAAALNTDEIVNAFAWFTADAAAIRASQATLKDSSGNAGNA